MPDELMTPGALLTPIHGWFTSGHNTVDLVQARAVLDSNEVIVVRFVGLC